MDDYPTGPAAAGGVRRSDQPEPLGAEKQRHEQWPLALFPPMRVRNRLRTAVPPPHRLLCQTLLVGLRRDAPREHTADRHHRSSPLARRAAAPARCGRLKRLADQECPPTERNTDCTGQSSGAGSNRQSKTSVASSPSPDTTCSHTRGNPFGASTRKKWLTAG